MSACGALGRQQPVYPFRSQLAKVELEGEFSEVRLCMEFSEVRIECVRVAS